VGLLQSEKIIVIESCVVGEFDCPKCNKRFSVRHYNRSDGKSGHRLEKSGNVAKNI
jgi:hypothetical protein